MKRIRLSIIAAVTVIAALFASCKNAANDNGVEVSVSKVTASQLPASGATQKITKENLQSVISEFIKYDYENDGLLYAGMKIVSDAKNEPEAPASNMRAPVVTSEDEDDFPLEEILPENVMKLLNEVFEKLAEIKSSNHDKTIEINLALENPGKLKNLPEGITISIDKASLKGTMEPHSRIEDDDTFYYFDYNNFEARAKASVAVDTAAVLKGIEAGEDVSSIIKGVFANVSASGAATYALSKETLTAETGLALSTGVSFCLPSGFGGKLILDTDILMDAALDEDGGEEVFKEIKYMFKGTKEGDPAIINKFFKKFNVKAAIYDDDGVLVDTFFETNTFYDILTEVLEILNEDEE